MIGVGVVATIGTCMLVRSIRHRQKRLGCICCIKGAEKKVPVKVVKKKAKKVVKKKRRARKPRRPRKPLRRVKKPAPKKVVKKVAKVVKTVPVPE